MSLLNPRLILGDTVCFLIFALLGIRSHDEALTITDFARAFAPFWLAWLLMAFIAGQLRSPVAALLGPTYRRVLVVWLPAWLIGYVIRSLVFSRPLVSGFGLVSFLVIGVLLVGWRSGWAQWHQAPKRLP